MLDVNLLVGQADSKGLRSAKSVLNFFCEPVKIHSDPLYMSRSPSTILVYTNHPYAQVRLEVPHFRLSFTRTLKAFLLLPSSAPIRILRSM